MNRLVCDPTETLAEHIAKPLRSEAEARRDREKRYSGERFAQSEKRWFEEARVRFDLAIGSARAAMEDARLSPASIELLDNHISDLVGDTWAVEKPWGDA